MAWPWLGKLLGCGEDLGPRLSPGYCPSSACGHVQDAWLQRTPLLFLNNHIHEFSARENKVLYSRSRCRTQVPGAWVLCCNYCRLWSRSHPPVAYKPNDCRQRRHVCQSGVCLTNVRTWVWSKPQQHSKKSSMMVHLIIPAPEREADIGRSLGLTGWLT